MATMIYILGGISKHRLHKNSQSQSQVEHTTKQVYLFNLLLNNHGLKNREKD